MNLIIHPLMHLLPTGAPLPRNIEELSELFTQTLPRIVRGPYEEAEDDEAWDPEETRKIVDADPRQALWAIAQVTGKIPGDSDDEDEDEEVDDGTHRIYGLLEALDAPLGVLRFQGRFEELFLRNSTFSDRSQVFSKAPRDGWIFPPPEGESLPPHVIRFVSEVSMETWKALRLVSRYFLSSVAPYEEMFHLNAFLSRRKLGDGIEEYKPAFLINGVTYRAPLPRSLGRCPSEVLFIEEDEEFYRGVGPEVSLTYEDGLVVTTGWKFPVSRVMGVPVKLTGLPVSESDLVFSPGVPFRKAVRRFYPPSLRIKKVRDVEDSKKLYSHRVMGYTYIHALNFFRSLRQTSPTDEFVELARVRYAKAAHPAVVRAAKIFYTRLGHIRPPEPEFYDQINPYDLIRVGARDVKTREELMSLIKPRHHYLTIVGAPDRRPTGLLKPKRLAKLMAGLLSTGIHQVTVENYPKGFTFNPREPAAQTYFWSPYVDDPSGQIDRRSDDPGQTDSGRADDVGKVSWKKCVAWSRH